MVKELKKLNRLDWVYEDIKVKYLGKDVYETAPEERF